MTRQTTARARRKSAQNHFAAPASSGEPVTTTPLTQDDNWVRLPKPGQSLCGLTRSYLYQLCARQTIRSITIRQPQNQRGVRLIYLPSILSFLASLDAEQNGQPKGKA